MCLPIDSRSPTSSLVEMRDIAFAAPTVLSASFTSSIKYRLLLAASLPPFRRRPLALDIANAATWGRLSGLDSNITSNTPMGTVICFSSRPSASLVLLSTRPTFVKESLAICRKPQLRDFNLAGVKESRESKAFAKPLFSAASRSFALALRISLWRDSRRSANVLIQLARSSGWRACRIRLPARAGNCYFWVWGRFSSINWG